MKSIPKTNISFNFDHLSSSSVLVRKANTKIYIKTTHPTCFFYKHVVYKHIQAQVWRLFKHMLSIMLSLAKYYCVKHFWVA